MHYTWFIHDPNSRNDFIQFRDDAQNIIQNGPLFLALFPLLVLQENDPHEATVDGFVICLQYAVRELKALIREDSADIAALSFFENVTHRRYLYSLAMIYAYIFGLDMHLLRQEFPEPSSIFMALGRVQPDPITEDVGHDYDKGIHIPTPYRTRK